MTQLEQLVAIAAQLTVLAAAAGGALLWFKRWVRKQVSEPMRRVEMEVSPDHGLSMKDAVDRTEQAVLHLARRFEDHLTLGHAAGAAPPMVVVERPARDA
jgi:hypothetical protein